MREYIEDCIEEFGENKELIEFLELIEKELETADEVQVIKEIEKGY